MIRVACRTCSLSTVEDREPRFKTIDRRATVYFDRHGKRNPDRNPEGAVDMNLCVFIISQSPRVLLGETQHSLNHIAKFRKTVHITAYTTLNLARSNRTPTFIPDMKLVQIYHGHVLADMNKQHPSAFNTSFHTAEEAPGHDVPSEEPYSLKRWLPLILRLRVLPEDAAQTVTLTPSQGRLLIAAAAGSVQTGTINRMYAEELEEDIIPAFSSLSFPPQGLFMRLDACSAKDGARRDPDKASLNSPEDILHLLVTSTRARNAMVASLDKGAPIVVYFLPFDARMGSANEYRVFCPPGGKKVSAISQYQWYKPWKFEQKHRDDVFGHIRRVKDKSEMIRLHIIQELQQGDEMDDLLLQQGFTFDIMFDDSTGKCDLIELNVFGIRSACGSCLFHWVKDWEILSGKDSATPEFRVSGRY